MLTTLSNFPKLNIVANSDIPEITRLIVHETGHIVAAAAVGIPTDFLVIDEASGAVRHGGYIDEAYRQWLELPFYHMTRIRILTAGFAAELAIFGAADLSVSSEDLSSIAELLGLAKADGWMMMTAQCARENYQPLLPPGAERIIKTIYPKIVSSIQRRRYLVDNAHVIPFAAFDDVSLQFTHGHRQSALDRTQEGCNRQHIVTALRDGARSGM